MGNIRSGYVNCMYIMRVGRIEMPDVNGMLPGTREHGPASIPAYCYLLEHDKGRVLVDTGLANEGLGVVREGEDVVSQLAGLGLTPSDIDYVVLTHMHLDHAAYMSAFPEATFVVRHEELKMAWWPDHFEGGYVLEQYAKTREFNFIEPADDEELDLFGDGSVRLLDTRGHSRGHQSVLVTLERDGRFVIAGDAAYFSRNLEEWILPGICTSSLDAERSIARLRHLRDCGWKLLFGHDEGQEQELRIVPAYYE